MTGAQGLLIGFHDLDRHELSFYAQTIGDGVRDDARRRVRVVSPTHPGPSLDPVP